MWFLGTMLWGCVTNNVIMLYVAIEATTLTSGLLVAFYWDRRALEAGYKYLMLLTIGITFALFGCVLLYASAAATNKLDGGSALLISDIRHVVQFIPGGTAAITIAFLLIGLGTKAGIAPFHPWLPDAHAEAPTPISVLLSGVMIKMSLYALARTVSIFYPAWPQVTIFIVALGTFSMLLGIIMALTQNDLKRLLAYSSVSQMGYVLVGIGLGTYLGCFAGGDPRVHGSFHRLHDLPDLGRQFLAQRGQFGFELLQRLLQRRALALLVFRQEEHTSELQSLRHLVCRLLLEK